MIDNDALWGLPHPQHEAAFYADVATKRLIAWAIDTVLTSLITLVIVVLTAFTAAFFLPLVFLIVNFFYRIAMIARYSATPGMRLTAIELRTHRGERFSGTDAMLHTAGFLFSVTMFPVQVLSMFLMVTTPRAQGLTDMLLGTAAVNRASRS